ncbi:bestrophin-like domain [Paludisphaera rhizosphaerae]|nr:DUF4239 domain-containing protein [Paludisphaera rhizosphaerae]
MSIDSYPVGLLLVPCCVVASLAGLHASRRWLPHDELVRFQDVASYLFAVVGTLYAVILGLVVVDSMSKFSEARLASEAESNALSEIILFTTQFPGDGSRRVRDLAGDYAKSVIETEWPTMAQHGHATETHKIAIELLQTVFAYEPKSSREEQLFATQVQAAADFWNFRRTRLVHASQSGLPTLEWMVLISGGVITVVFAYFFKVEHLRLQLAMTSMLAAVIALNLYLILMFASPFSGDLQVVPEGFHLTRVILDEVEGHHFE